MRTAKHGRWGDRRHHALEALARLGQLGRHDRRLVGDLAAHVGGDQANDALGLGTADALAGILAPDRGPLDPQLAVGVDHHLDHGGIGERRGDGGTERGAQHLPAAALRLLGGGREKRSAMAAPSRAGPRTLAVGLVGRARLACGGQTRFQRRIVRTRCKQIRLVDGDGFQHLGRQPTVRGDARPIWARNISKRSLPRVRAGSCSLVGQWRGDGQEVAHEQRHGLGGDDHIASDGC